jgi:hypothetical protein
MVKEGPQTGAVQITAALMVSIALGYYVGQPWRWFSWHPLLMLLGFCAATMAGVLTKIKGGRVNTINHGYIMLFAFALSLGGWYVIHEQKAMLNKKHLTTWHAWFGIAAIVGFGLGALGGAIGLHPDFGVLKTNQLFRLAHKTLARTAALTAFTAIVTGWYTVGGGWQAEMGTGPVSTALVVAFLIALALRMRLLGGATPFWGANSARS